MKKKAVKIINNGKKSYSITFWILFASIVLSILSLQIFYGILFALNKGAIYTLNYLGEITIEQTGLYETTVYDFYKTEYIDRYTVENLKIKHIKERAGRNNNYLTNVEMYGLESVGDYAFANARNLTMLDIESKKFGKNIIEGTSKLLTIHIETSKIEAGSFVNAPALFTVHLYNVDEVEENAFRGCNNLTQIHLHGKRTKMPQSLTGNASENIIVTFDEV